MPALQVRDCPPALYQALQERAGQEHRSMAQQTIVALEEHLAGPRRRAMPGGSEVLSWNDGSEEERGERAARKKAVFKRIEARNAAAADRRIAPEAIVHMVRDMREERTDRILSAFAEGQPSTEEAGGQER